MAMKSVLNLEKSVDYASSEITQIIDPQNDNLLHTGEGNHHSEEWK